MSSVLIECSRRYDLRPVDWRWQRAKYVHAHGCSDEILYEGEDDDRWLAAAMQLLKTLAELDGENDGYVLEQLHHTYAAWDIYTKKEHEILRHEVEARLLTREAFRDIAKRFGIMESVLYMYHGLFFDVREHLDFPSYIMNKVVGDGTTVRMTEYTLWKLCAYWGGTEVLDGLVYRNPTGVLSGTDELDHDANLISVLRKHISMTLSLTPAGDSENLSTILMAFDKLQDSAQKANQRRKDNNLVTQLSAVLQNVKWQTGRLKMPDTEAIPGIMHKSWSELVEQSAEPPNDNHDEL